jgi:hypothetical protein
LRLRSPIVCALWLSSIAPHALAQSRHSAGGARHSGTPAETAPTAATPPANGDVGTQAERDKQARLEFEHGRKAFDEGDYRGAWGFFHNAYRLSGRAQLLFNIGQTADRLGRDSEALTAFRMYLERLPKAENKRDVENRIRALEERVKDANRVPPPPGSEEASAEPVPPPSAASSPATTAPSTHVDQPPPPPPPPEAAGNRPTRQGFYLRLGLGAGLRRDGVSGGIDGSLSGVGFAGEFAFGWTLWPGFVGGGAFYSDLASSPTFTGENGAKEDLGSAHLTMFGPMADWYPQPKDSGFHVQAALTFAVIAVDYKEAGLSIGRDASGIGLILGIGYEWPIAAEWALGVLGRLSLATLSDDERSHGVFAPSAVCTLTWY